MQNKNICGMCQKVKEYTVCLGCEIPICEQCARFEIIGSGCGCVWPVYYCSACAQNPMINPNAVFRDPDT